MASPQKGQAITRHFNKTLALACTLIAISTFNYGFDNQAYSTTQAMTPFARKFGVYNEKKKQWVIESYWLSLFNSLMFIGFFVGVFIGSSISKRFGRRWCMFTMSAYALITATIAVTAQNRDQILCARVLNYIYVGMELAVVPVYQSEIVPAPVRGMIVGTYQFSLIFGGLIINAICRGTSTLNDDRAFRIPYGLFYVVPTIVLSLVFFCPESPRWLLTKGKIEEARTALFRLRRGTKPDHEIEAELEAIQLSLSEADSFESGKFKELFQGVNRKRTAIVVACNFFQQATGQAFSSHYGAIFIKSIGTVNPFNVTLINAVANLVSVMATLFLADRVGRRALLLIGGFVQMAALMTMGGLGVPQPVSLDRGKAIVAMLTIYSAGFSFGWAPLNYVITTEVPALRLRDYSQRVASVSNVATNFVVNFTLPYLMDEGYAALHSKVGFIFGSMAAAAIVFTYFCVPECRGLSLEQVDKCFHEQTPLRKFQSQCLRDLEAELVASQGKADEAEEAAVEHI